MNLNTINCFICNEMRKKIEAFKKNLFTNSTYKQNNSKYMYSTKTQNCTTFSVCWRGW